MEVKGNFRHTNYEILLILMLPTCARARRGYRRWSVITFHFVNKPNGPLWASQKVVYLSDLNKYTVRKRNHDGTFTEYDDLPQQFTAPGDHHQRVRLGDALHGRLHQAVAGRGFREGVHPPQRLQRRRVPGRQQLKSPEIQLKRAHDYSRVARVLY